MNIYIPYTYLIGWSKHNIWYYGRRTAKNCNPNDFWKTYFTSSTYVKEFRKQHGEPDILQIRKTFTNNPDACKLWESNFLKRIDAQNDSRFLNKRNSDHKWDTTGIPNVRYNDTQEKREKTILEKYNVKNIFENKQIKVKIKNTNIERYGVDNPSKNEEIKSKKVETCLKNFGVDNPSKSKEIRYKKTETFIKNFGVEHYSKIEKVCNYCNELNNINHEHQCKLNPNRKTGGRSGDKHPNAKLFIVISPSNERFEVRGGLRNFCKVNNISFNNLYYRNTAKGWHLDKQP